MTSKKQPDQQRLGVRLNIWMLKMARNWVRVALLLIGIYITLPFLAPTLMKLGMPGPANAIYTMYSPLCHQFAFRSFFLYGEQPVYPREIVGTDWRSYEAYSADFDELPIVTDPTDFTPQFFWPAREFVGNEQMGYKVTLCERDIAIYIAMFAGGLIYSRLRWRLRPVPWWLYILLGLGPIALDGGSQLLSYPPISLWPVRETAPFFRVLTGALFGLMNVWLGFPYLERSMWDTRRQIESKLHRAGIPFD